MAKYVVEITEHAVYEITIEARTRASAENKAEKLFLGKNGIMIKEPWAVEVIDRYVEAIKLP